VNSTIQDINFGTALIAIAVASVLFSACAAAPAQLAGLAEIRSELTELQTDPNLGSRAPLAIEEAEVAVRVAEQPQADARLVQHRIYMADRKIETARAQAETRLAEDERSALSEQLESARLAARTREADAVQVVTMSSEQQAMELQRLIDELQAQRRDRALVMALGDVVFTSGHADMKAAAAGNLDKLVAFLDEYPNRTVTIEGYTDSIGSPNYNQRLSQRRADSVKTYLVGQGIGSMRLVASGKGEAAPVAGNESADGRQQNRRVEVIIHNPAGAALR
jgi:outer membrane protein OmpA-like peptidoglycan-associated protein